MKRIAIYGAGGFGKEVKGMLEMQGLSFAGFLDDFKEVGEAAVSDSFDDVVLAIADPVIRKHLMSTWKHKQVPFLPIIAKDVILHKSVTFGKGTVLCPGAKFTVDIQVGDFVIVNLNATVGHDVKIGDYSAIMPSVNISGNVTIGEGVFVGTGASILQGLTIGDYAIIGAGALVTHSVASGQTVVGVPAKEIKK